MPVLEESSVVEENLPASADVEVGFSPIAEELEDIPAAHIDDQLQEAQKDIPQPSIEVR